MYTDTGDVSKQVGIRSKRQSCMYSVVTDSAVCN
jgi:hypothetical protein